MLRILLIDDEQIVLDGMKLVLESAGKDWVVVGTALDGEKGLLEVREKKPDIVITDIKMPEMDGLTMSTIIREEFPEIVIFVFSGYAEFNLAQKAIAVGAYDYILKPINYEDIYKSLEKAEALIGERKLFHLEHEELVKGLKASMPIIREKLLSDLIHGVIGVNDNIFYRLKYLEFDVSDAFLCLMRIDDFETVTKNYNVEDRYLLIFAVRNITEEVIGRAGKSFYIVNESDDTLCLIVYKLEEDKNAIMSLCEEIRSNIFKYLNKSVSIGVGRFAKNIEDLRYAYDDSMGAIQSSLFKIKDVTVHIDEVLPEGSPSIYSLAIEKNIIRAVKSGDMELLTDELDHMYRNLKPCNFEYAKRLLHELYISLSRSLYESGINAEEALKGRHDVYAEISESSNVDEAVTILLEVLKYLVQHIGSVKLNQRKRIINEVIKYIEENYASNISLKDAADRVYLNLNYLSAVFKAETGENFTEYLKRFRVTRAIELMDRMDLKIYHISEMVGYSDSKHFSQVFKEITGVSPKDYKAGGRGK